MKAGDSFGDRFILQSVLGSGDEGGVWLAEDRQRKRKVVLKLLPAVISRHPQALAELKDTTHRSSGLVHRHIARTHEFVVAGDIAGVVLEFVEGKTMTQLRGEQPQGVFEPGDLAGWLPSLCGALEYAHLERNLVHGGLRPDNLLIDTGGRLKLTGFGLAGQIKKWLCRLGSGWPGEGGAGSGNGPAVQEPAVSDDVFGVAATVYELLTGTAAFGAGGDPGSGKKEAVPSISQRRTALGISGQAIAPAWEETVAACLVREPAGGPRTVGELARRLGGVRPDVP
ncbi:MAG TPA: protein kinase [Chthoniobacterales bacterium]